ncbi:helix-turn-helix domain-containing protein [Pontimonas sp.]|jgi:excisionase family DNA binding protein|uniref:helix-turn-helix domain-containing protein n=1 Tax=Pontimonas sp. TaxID=2304492 RepID=UPI00286FF089|nr:helix-turn-helix domain-containing protein [Pontimonas sp.]MDR9396170.1 helix-turn-helix domain-containing protein [Pontimonas sp.]MDR9434539.1 helix-turn-helix domain-containing protein [Pontimonas sp.]
MHESSAPMRFFTVQEVADTMRVSSMTVYRMVHAGEIPAIRFGRSFRIPESAMDQLVGHAGNWEINQAG